MGAGLELVLDHAYGSTSDLGPIVDLSSFANFSRDELIAKARALGVERAELMTRVELADEIVRRMEPDPVERKRARGWLGVARDLVASVVESGLNLPDAAAVIRGDRLNLDLKTPEPVATVTLAEIYATQGHTERALEMLGEVLASESDHAAAQSLRERLLRERSSRGAARPAARIASSPEPAGALEAPASLEPEISPTELQNERPLTSASDSAVEPAAAESFVQVATAALPALLDPPPSLSAAELPGIDLPASDQPRIESSARFSPTLVILRSEGADPLVCWELGAMPEQEPLLQIVCVALARVSGEVERSELTVPVTEPRGSAVLESLPSEAVVRAALGVGEGSEFLPLAIASELRTDACEVAVTYRPAVLASVNPSETERSLAREFAL